MRGFAEALAKASESDSQSPLRELYLDGCFSLRQDDSFKVGILVFVLRGLQVHTVTPNISAPEILKSCMVICFLTACFSPSIPPSLQDLSRLSDLERLSLGGCNIRGSSLASFPPLQQLTGLILTDNAIAGNLDPLTVLTNLKDLDLSGNRITDLSALAPLTALSHLSSLDISGCPAENTDPVAARKTIAEMLAVLPALKYINGEDLLGNGENQWLFK